MFFGALLGAALWAAQVPQAQRFAAEVDDTYALRVNPAGLAFLEGGELRLLYSRDGTLEELGDGNGFGVYGASQLFDGLTLGVGYDRAFHADDRAAGALRLGLGMGAQGFAIGAGFAHVEPFDGDDQDQIDLGFSARPYPWLAMGGRVSDISENLGRRGYALSLGVRMLSGRVLLSGQVGIDTARALVNDRPEIAGRLEVEPLAGLRLGASMNDDLDVFGQLALDFGKTTVGGFVEVRDARAAFGGDWAVYDAPRRRLARPTRVAVLDLSGDLRGDPRIDLIQLALREDPYGDVPRLLDRLATVEDVDGVYLRIGRLSVGWGVAEELRRSTLRIRRAGRRVDCFLSGTNDIAYYVASACDAIITAPPVTLQVDGLASVGVYLGDLLGRLGVAVEVERFERYKTAPETFTRAQRSAAEEEQLGAYLDGVFERLVGGIAEGRGLSARSVREHIDLAAATATAALAERWVDHVLYPDQVEGHLRDQYGGAPVFTSAREAARSPGRRWRRSATIGVVHLDAPITSGRSTTSPLGLGRTVGSDDIIRALERARGSGDIRAVVLRVDSPGGEALASDLIARAVERLAERKPVYASFGDVAASGGYYAAAPATRIYAEPTTLTGSIGIYSLKLDLSVLLARIGVGVSVLERGELAGDRSPLVRRSEAGDRAMRRALAAGYGRFLRVVSEGRAMTVDEVKAVAGGRIWSGEAALEAGLVDELGGYVDALRAAARVAGHELHEVEIVQLPDSARALADPVELLRFAARGERSDGVTEAAQILLGPLARSLDERLPLLATDAPLALLPYLVEVE